jgi:hypothetical protein
MSQIGDLIPVDTHPGAPGAMHFIIHPIYVRILPNLKINRFVIILDVQMPQMPQMSQMPQKNGNLGYLVCEGWRVGVQRFVLRKPQVQLTIDNKVPLVHQVAGADHCPEGTFNTRERDRGAALDGLVTLLSKILNVGYARKEARLPVATSGPSPKKACPYLHMPNPTHLSALAIRLQPNQNSSWYLRHTMTIGVRAIDKPRVLTWQSRIYFPQYHYPSLPPRKMECHSLGSPHTSHTPETCRPHPKYPSYPVPTMQFYLRLSVLET